MRNFFPFLVLLIAFSCDSSEDNTPPTNVLGEVTVDLDANKNIIRSQESLIGNMVADAFKDYGQSEGYPVDIAFINGGSIRFSESNRPDGIYPAGEYNSEIFAEMFPWYDERLFVVDLMGLQLKQVLERSVSSLPEEYKGWFMQVSDGLVIEVNTSNQAQVIDETVNPPEIDVPGERIMSIKINNENYVDTAYYKIMVTRFINYGEDGYVTLLNIPDSLRQELSCDCELYEKVLSDYIKANTPVTPMIEGRILFVEN